MQNTRNKKRMFEWKFRGKEKKIVKTHRVDRTLSDGKKK